MKTSSFLQLLRDYNKVEIPIIQRDYVQGRKEIRPEQNKQEQTSFAQVLINALTPGGTPEELDLDFIYGVSEEKTTSLTIDWLNHKVHQAESEARTFVPLDGQQRLTTLFLLHWYLVYKAGEKAEYGQEVRALLSKFTYETRPSVHDFCTYLCHKGLSLPELVPDTTAEYIAYIRKNTIWFDPEWEKDITIHSMLCMLHGIDSAFAKAEKPVNYDEILKTLLGTQPSITFHLLDINQFGMGEEIYLRMNARGKILTPFENFKAEFYKILVDEMAESRKNFKERIEDQWVTGLWRQRGKERGKERMTLDKAFMKYMGFITTMLYYTLEKAPKDAEDYRLYAAQDHLNFLIFAFDAAVAFDALAEGEAISNFWWSPPGSFQDVFLAQVNPDKDSNVQHIRMQQNLIAYAALLYLDKKMDRSFSPDSFNRIVKSVDFTDYLHVCRNLIHHSNINAGKDDNNLFSLISSLKKLIGENVYMILYKGAELSGVSLAQRREEALKASLICRDSEFRTLFREAEAHAKLQGNITPLLVATWTWGEQGEEGTQRMIDSFSSQQNDWKRPTDFTPALFDKAIFRRIWDSYRTLSESDFIRMRGALLNTSLYGEPENKNGCAYLWHNPDDYHRKASTLLLVREHSDFLQEPENQNKLTADENTEIFFIAKEKEFIHSLIKDQTDKEDAIARLRSTEQWKQQLYLYYIIDTRLFEHKPLTFFNGYYNFFKVNDNYVDDISLRPLFNTSLAFWFLTRKFKSSGKKNTQYSRLLWLELEDRLKAGIYNKLKVDVSSLDIKQIHNLIFQALLAWASPDATKSGRDYLKNAFQKFKSDEASVATMLE